MTDQTLEIEQTAELRAEFDEVQQTATSQPGGITWKNEIISLLILGVPMGLTQFVQFSINTIDVLMIGKLGSEALAAASLGLVIYYATWLAGFGPMMAVTPMVSQTLGADPNNTRDARASVRMGLYTIVLSFPFMFLVYFFAADIALALGQPEELATLAGPYVLALAPGLPFALGVFLLRNFLATLGQTRVPLLVIVFTTGLNALFNWLLIYGNWGFPRLELVGAGIASTLCHMSGFAILAVYVSWEKRAKTFDLFGNIFRPHWARFKEIIRLGWPISLTFGFEVMLFNVAVFLMGLIGINEVAAYQVALNVAAMAFMIPLGLSMAGCVRVGLAAGAGDQNGIRKAAGAAILVSTAAIMLFAIPVSLFPEQIARMYLDANDPANIAVIGLVASFLPIAAAFMLFDGVQVAAAQVLRGLKDVNIPMIMTGFSYWGVGFPVAFIFGLHTTVGAVGIWWGLLAGLATASLLLGGRLLYLILYPGKQPD